MFRSLLAASAMTAAVALTSPALAGEHAMPRTISLSGHGEVRLAPDTAIVNLGVASQAPAAKDALAANTAAMQSVFAALKAASKPRTSWCSRAITSTTRARRRH